VTARGPLRRSTAAASSAPLDEAWEEVTTPVLDAVGGGAGDYGVGGCDRVPGTEPLRGTPPLLLHSFAIQEGAFLETA
jgi:hypothetical protein